MFPKIIRLDYVKDRLDYHQRDSCRYKFKVKLHGTHGQINTKNIVFSSRNKELSAEYDNYDFTKTLNPFYDTISQIKGDYIIFGEWCGKGIQNGVACSKIDRTFFIFLLQDLKTGFYIYEPDTITSICTSLLKFPTFRVIPWIGDVVTIYRDKTTDAEAYINTIMTFVETEDPLIKTLFNISDVGEGIVGYPLLDELRDLNLFFKCKGHNHQEKVRVKDKHTLTREEIRSIDEFINTFVTPTRAQKYYTPTIPKHEYITNTITDVLSESYLELKEGNFPIRRVKSKLGKHLALTYDILHSTKGGAQRS